MRRAIIKVVDVKIFDTSSTCQLERADITFADGAAAARDAVLLFNGRKFGDRQSATRHSAHRLIKGNSHLHLFLQKRRELLVVSLNPSDSQLSSLTHNYMQYDNALDDGRNLLFTATYCM